MYVSKNTKAQNPYQRLATAVVTKAIRDAFDTGKEAERFSYRDLIIFLKTSQWIIYSGCERDSLIEKVSANYDWLCENYKKLTWGTC